MKIDITSPGRQRWIIISAAFSALMVSIDSSIVNISLPSMSKYFNVSPSIVSWVVLSYLIAITSSMLIFGKIADLKSVKRVFIAGYAIFTVSSFLCAASGTIYLLIASRFFQGLGAAMMNVSSFTIIPRFLPEKIRGKSYGIVGSLAAVGVAIGAPLGGVITGYFSWHWIFLINIPVGILAIITAFYAIPAAESVKSKASFDFLGSVLSVMGVFAFTYAINMGQEKGWMSSVILTCFTASAVLAVLFFLHERKHPAPLLEFRLFKNKSFTFGTLAAFAAFMLLGGNGFLLPFYLIVYKGVATQFAGFLTLIFSVVYVIIGPLSGALSDKINPKRLSIAGMLSGTGAFFVFFLMLKEPGLMPIIIFLVWAAVSIALFMSPNNNMIMSNAPFEMQGVASAVFRAATNMGIMMGVLCFETIFTHSLPAELMKNGASLQSLNISPSLIIEGIKHAYLAGVLICVISVIFSLMTSGKYEKRNVNIEII